MNFCENNRVRADVCEHFGKYMYNVVSVICEHFVVV
jgi:hypothetical protein